jgi:hypothetical protein
MCHLIWLCSRKYGTVWYHPASSKLWYLTAFPFVNFQEKLTGTSRDSLRVWSQLVRLAVCLALGAHFASTLPSVIWSLRTTQSRATGYTPFFLVYGAEAVLPTDLEYESPKVNDYDKDTDQLLTVLTTNIRPSLSQEWEEDITNFMHILSTNEVPRAMARRPFSPRTWNTNHPKSRITMKTPTNCWRSLQQIFDRHYLKNERRI